MSSNTKMAVCFLSENLTHALPKQQEVPQDKVQDKQLQRVLKAPCAKNIQHNKEPKSTPSIPKMQQCPVQHRYPTRSKQKNTRRHTKKYKLK